MVERIMMRALSECFPNCDSSAERLVTDEVMSGGLPLKIDYRFLPFWLLKTAIPAQKWRCLKGLAKDGEIAKVLQK